MTLELIDFINETEGVTADDFPPEVTDRINSALGGLTDTEGGPSPGEEQTAIWDWHDLDAVREDSGGDYVLVKDLDEDSPGYSEVVENGGFDSVSLFYGTFDGNGHVIEDLVIDQDGFAGLFAQTGASGSSGEIRNLGLENVDVSGDGLVGALVGSNSANTTITNVYVTGAVEGSGNKQTDATGGLVGRNNGEIRESFSAADVTGNGLADVGSLLGRNKGVVEQSYAIGSASSDSEEFSAAAGGLVGVNSDATVTTSYATGDVSAAFASGGLVGDNNDALSTLLEKSYWDKGTTNQDRAAFGREAENSSGFGSTDDTEPASEMTGSAASTNMDALDFEDTWATVSGEYPVLQGIDRDAQLSAR